MQDKVLSSPTLRDLLFTLFRYRWVAGGVLLLILVIGVTLTIIAPRVFEAKTRIFIGADLRQLKLNQSDPTTRPTLEQLIATEAEIARSLPVIERALATASETRSSLPNAATLISLLQVMPVRNTSLVEFRLQHTDAALAADLLNEVVAAYIDRRAQTGRSGEEVAQFEQHLAHVSTRIDSLERVATAFQQKHAMSRADTQIDNELERRSKLLEAKLAMDRELVALQLQLQDVRSLLDDFNPAHIPSNLTEANPQIRGWLAELLTTQSDRLEMGRLYHPDAPELMRVDERLQDLIGLLKAQLLRHEVLLVQQFSAKESELNMISQEVKAIDERNRELSGAVIRSTDLNLQLADLRGIRTVVVRQLEETRLRSAETGSLRVEALEEAKPPRTPIKPNVVFNLLATFVIAIIAGVSLPLYLQVMSSAIVHDYDITRSTGLTVLCNVREC
jgi:polysaccharide biosynthesis transport protein